MAEEAEVFKKILVPVDSLEWSNTLAGVKSAIEFSSGCKVVGEPELIFMHVFQSKSRVPIDEKESLREMRESKVDKDFEQIKEMCEEGGLSNFKTIKKEGEPHEVIIETAKGEDVELIVMGSGKLHDRSAEGRLHKFVYGSVTENVLHKAPCSVLVTRPTS